MEVSIKFRIDDNMVYLCIVFLLSKGRKITKKAIVDICKACLYHSGDAFSAEPHFQDYDEEDVVIKDEAFHEECTKIFNKIWK